MKARAGLHTMSATETDDPMISVGCISRSSGPIPARRCLQSNLLIAAELMWAMNDFSVARGTSLLAIQRACNTSCSVGCVVCRRFKFAAPESRRNQAARLSQQKRVTVLAGAAELECSNHATQRSYSLRTEMLSLPFTAAQTMTLRDCKLRAQTARWKHSSNTFQPRPCSQYCECSEESIAS